MKKTITSYTLWLMLLLAGVFTMASCGDDNDDPKLTNEQQKAAVIGTWQLEKANLLMQIPTTSQTMDIMFKWENDLVVAYLNGKKVPFDQTGIDLKDMSGFYARITFKNDGHYSTYDYENGKWTLDDSGEYEIKDGKLIVKEKGEQPQALKIITLNNSTMELDLKEVIEAEAKMPVKSCRMTMKKVK